MYVRVCNECILHYVYIYIYREREFRVCGVQARSQDFQKWVEDWPGSPVTCMTQDPLGFRV